MIKRKDETTEVTEESHAVNSGGGTQARTQDQVAEQMEGNSDAAEVALKAADEIADVLAEMEVERDKVKELEDQLLRRAAEFQNYRRRTQEDLAYAAERGRAEVVTRMIEVLDDLRRTREAAEEMATVEKSGPLYDALKEGVDLVYKKLEDNLASFGVRPIEAVGQPFDERFHEALMQQDSPDWAPGTVLAEIQKGYTMGERVLRHVQVVVAR
jgi:molecular chaperone GrpE